MKMLLSVLLSLMVAVTACFAQTTVTSNPKETAFLTAIRNKDIGLVKKLLKEDKNLITVKNQNNDSVLHIAAQFSDEQIFKILLDSGADINAMNNRRSKPIHVTTMFGKKEMTELLLQKGVSLREMNAFGLYPIQYAVDSGNIALVELLITNGEKYTEISSRNATLLHFAAGSGSIPMYEFIASKGLDPNALDAQGNTMLHHASTSTVDMVKYLVAKGFDIRALDMWGMIPAVTSCYWNKRDILMYYLTNGITINEKFGPDNNTMLHLVAAYGPIDMAMFLLDNGADVNAVNSSNESVLSITIMNNKMNTVKLLIDRGASINPGICKDGTTCTTNVRIPLHMAALTNVELTNYLLEKGADINAIDTLGDTALVNAIYRDKPDIAKTLIERGIKTDTVNNQMSTPLHIAVEHGSIEIIKLLLEKKVRVDLKDKKGQTPLHIASVNGYGDIVTLLLQNGSDVSVKDNAKHTPFYYADYCNNESVKALLLTAGAKKTDIGKNNNTLMTKELKNGESVVWFLGHSGWAIKTKNNLIIIDYFENGTASDTASLFNGRIHPDELKNLNVTVFVSHTHADHYSPAIFSWKDKIPGIRYVFGFDDTKSTVPYEKMTQRETKMIGDIKVSTIEANDSGVGFLIEADGVVLFHVGDHANRNRELSGNYCPEIDHIAAMNKKIDLLFLPVSGCGFGDIEAVKKGDYYAIQKLQPKVVVPMHGDTTAFETFISALKTEKIKTRTYVPVFKGDRMFYKQ